MDSKHNKRSLISQIAPLVVPFFLLFLAVYAPHSLAGMFMEYIHIIFGCLLWGAMFLAFLNISKLSAFFGISDEAGAAILIILIYVLLLLFGDSTPTDRPPESRWWFI